MFLHEIDFETSALVIALLDSNDDWKDVAADFQFNDVQINGFLTRQEGSESESSGGTPAGRMMDAMRSLNTSVLDLAKILWDRNLLRPLKLLRK